MPYAQDIIDDARAYADDLFRQAESFLSNWAVSSLPGWADNLAYSADTLMPSFTDPSSFTSVAPNMSFSYTEPVYESMYIPATPTMPTAVTPLDTSTLFQTPKPAYDLPVFTATVPTVNTSFAVPAAPTLNNIDAPILTDPTLPTEPVVNIPQFTATFRGTDLTDPAISAVTRFNTMYDEQPELIRSWIDGQVTEWVNRVDPGYTAAVQELETKLSEAMSGTLVSESLEQGLFDRARYRAELELQRAQREVTEAYTKRGFALPAGAMVTARMQVQQATAAELGKQATDIAVEVLKMNIQHMQFALNVSMQMRQAMIQAAIAYGNTLVQVNNQALEAAKAIAQIAIDEYNQRIAVFNAYLEYWKTEVAVYEMYLKSSLAKLEIYRIELDAAKLQVEIDQLLIQEYTALIDAEVKKMDVYVARINAIVQTAGLEKLKIDLFSSQVQAYAAQVQAKEAEYGVYTAAIQGDTALVNAYTQEVNAYSAQVEAAKIAADIDIAHSDAIIKYNSALTEQFKAELMAESERIKALGLEFASEVDAYKATLEGVAARNAASTAELEGSLKLDEMRLRAAEVNYQGEVGQRNVDTEYYSKQMATVASEINAKAEIAGSLAQAAVTAASGIVSYSEYGTVTG